ncbi:MAG: ABC transporter ATP-binding protein, partial [Anaerolineales bacterium]|nr:ABC transporter ATP-binding protein [Anaerolineales bacterium]
MLRLAKYLKPYTAFILISIAILFVQANADLALPDYMSKIVNNGIQQGGVENAVPQAVRQSEMNKLLFFMTPQEQALVLEHYILADQNAADYAILAEKYPALADEPVYVLKTADKTALEEMNALFGKAWLVVTSLERLAANPQAAAAMEQSLGFDLSKLPPGMDLFAVLRTLPPAQADAIKQTINQRFAALGERMITQMAVGAVRREYDALGMNTDRMQIQYILRIGGLMLSVTLLSIACTITVGFLSARVAAGLARDLRRDVFRKVQSFANAELDRFSTASLITRSTNDVTQIQMVVAMMMRLVIYAPIIGVGGVIRALDKSTSMWWIIALAVIVLLGLILTVFSIALPKFKMIQELVDRLNLVMRENLTGMMVIRAFNMQEYEEGRFDKANTDLTNLSLFVNRIMVVMMPVMMLIMNGLSLAIIWVGAHQVAESQMQVGDMMAFLQYAMQIVFAFLMMSFMFIMLPRASVSAGRIAEVLETEISIRDPEAPRPFPEPFRPEVEFRNVSFRYPGAEENVLHNISFIARPGETTAIIGSTGSGKSTIISLIPRFYDVTEGAILVDGVDIRQVTQQELRAKIGYVPQKGTLFSGTIESNLKYADENASEQDLMEAAEIAQATDFIFSRENGWKAEVSQAGSNFSGGQKQRLAIARALVKKAPIYIFDDSFSMLDFKTDAALRKALKEKTKGSTVFIVSQRVATIMHAEQIIVLDQGKIVGKGKHHELMETCDVYRDIALSQIG